MVEVGEYKGWGWETGKFEEKGLGDFEDLK